MRTASSSYAPEATSVRTDLPDRPSPRSPLGMISFDLLLPYLSVVLPAIAVLVAKLSVSDLSFVLRAGDIMIRTQEILRTDLFSFTMHGSPWLNQQWGGQVLLSGAGVGGWAGLIALRAALTGATFYLLYRALRSRGADPGRAGWIGLAAFALAGTSSSSFALRPQLFVLPLFALTVWILADRRQHPSRLWLLPLLTVLWANLHGSFFLGPLLVGLTWLEDLGERVERANRLLGLAVLSSLATLVNPFGFDAWTYVATLSSNPVIRGLISEWQRPAVLSLPGVALYGSAAMLAILLLRSPRRPRWPALAWLAVFFVIGFQAERGLVWWILAASLQAARHLPEQARDRVPDRPSAVPTAIAAGVTALAVAVLPWWRSGSLERERLLPAEAPPRLTRALEASLAPGERIFNSSRWGSWFVFALPQNPVFVDSRIEVYSLDVWNQYFAISRADEDWKEALERWDVAAVAAHRKEQAGLIDALEREPDWRLIHRSEDGFIFVRS